MKRTIVLLVISAVAIFALATFSFAADRGTHNFSGGVLFPINPYSDGGNANAYDALNNPSVLKAWWGLKGEESKNGPWGTWKPITIIAPDDFTVTPNPLRNVIDNLVIPHYGYVSDSTTIKVPDSIVILINKKDNEGNHLWRYLDGYAELFGTGADKFVLSNGTQKEGLYVYIHYMTDWPWANYTDNVFVGLEAGWSKVELDGVAFGQNFAYGGAYLKPGDPKREEIRYGCHWYYNPYDLTLIGGTGMAVNGLEADADRLSLFLKLRLVADMQEIGGVFSADWPWGRYIEFFVGGGIGADYTFGNAHISDLVAHTGLKNNPSVLLMKGYNRSFGEWSLAWFGEAGITGKFPIKEGEKGYITVSALYRHADGGGANIRIADMRIGDKPRDYYGFEVGYAFDGSKTVKMIKDAVNPPAPVIVPILEPMSMK